MTGWTTRTVQLRFALSDWTLGAWKLPLDVCQISLAEGIAAGPSMRLPEAPVAAGTAGFLVRGIPIAETQPAIAMTAAHVRYVQKQYRHYYIDMGMSFDEYKAKFSSKTRSTISRKIKRFSEQCGGSLRWRSYSGEAEMLEFHRVARAVSALTYQERLLDAGLPGSDAFIEQMKTLARNDCVRAFVLFDGERPVSYLYCPVIDDVLIYAYLGYDPAYLKLSVGTVLQWLALEQLFAERRFRYFDFTEGESDHKRLFATHEILAANVLYLPRNLKNRLLVRAHAGFERRVEALGVWLEEKNLKRRVRRLIRFGSRQPSAPVE